MKKIYTLIAACAIGFMSSSCNDFLDYTPTAVIDEETAFQEPDKMVVSAYAMLGDCWFTYPFNLFPYGDVTSDDCLKGGGGTTDTDYHHMEIWSTLTPSTPGHMDELWYRLYCAISRCNRALVSLQEYGEAELGKDLTGKRVAEVKFLRAHFYYKLITLFYRVPWIDEVAYKENSAEKISNKDFTHEELLLKLIDDFKAAYDVLPDVQDEGGRVNRMAAASYIAKCYLDLAWGDGYEKNTGVEHINKEYMQKVIDYTDELAASTEYGYMGDFGDIFLPGNKNSKESVFAVQTSDYKEDHTKFGRANWSIMLNGCWGMWSCGWDFHKPSQNLVNAFKTKDGLPMFDDYNDEIGYPVNGNVGTQKWDPRLFHTVGMPSFPYKYEDEYIQTVANSRTPNLYGYYTSLKEVPQRSKGETYNGSWQAFATNDYVFRYTDVMLMRAEALVEMDRMDDAEDIVNDIRNRAAASVDKHIKYAKDHCEINLYPDGYFADKETARKCVRWERRLEMAMENGRYFDLRRWGIASETLTAFFESEQNDVYTYTDDKGEVVEQTYAGYYKDARYTTDKNEYFPIPYNQMFYKPGLYDQNLNY